jgi:hypothetical protein
MHCSASSVIGCWADEIPVDKPIPGTNPNSGMISGYEAIKKAYADFAKGVSHATVICQDKKKCCSSVRVYVSCHGMNWTDTNAINGVYHDICQKSQTINCGNCGK